MKIPREQFRILRELDVEAARPLFVVSVGQPIIEPGKGDPILASLHKARIRAGKAFTQEEREQSRQWLKANGYKAT